MTHAAALADQASAACSANGDEAVQAPAAKGLAVVEGGGVALARQKRGASAAPTLVPAVIAPALRAARVLAAAHGLPTARAAVLHAGSNVVVHLAPAPVVVRVMTGTTELHDNPAVWLGREVAVCTHLVRLGAAVVAPSDELPAGPHEIEGLWLTCWRRVDVDRAAPTPRPEVLGRALRDLHAAMALVPVELEPHAAVRDELDGLLDRLDDPRALAWRAELAAIPPGALGVDGATQPIHGDASLSNLLATTDGQLLWADFEDVRRGPVEADVAGLLDAARSRGLPPGFGMALLSAYGAVDEAVLEAQLELHALYGAAWRTLSRGRGVVPR